MQRDNVMEMPILGLLLQLSFIVTSSGVHPGCECLVYSGTFGKDRGIFTSPDFPKAYPPDIDCLLYTFVASSDEIIEITFNDFDIRKTQLDCVYGDYLKLFLHLERGGEVNEYTPWTGLLCGSLAEVPQVLYSSGPGLVLEFHSAPPPGNSSGFKGTFRFIDRRLFQTDGQKLPGTMCDHQFVSSDYSVRNGKFYSPRYPSSYPKNIRCAYRFKGRLKERIRIIFEEVTLQRGDLSCLNRADLIKVHDGRSPSSPTVAMLCNEVTEVEVLSTSPDLFIEFVANSEWPGQGFKAKFEFQPIEDEPSIDSKLKLAGAQYSTSIGPAVSAASIYEKLLEHFDYDHIASGGGGKITEMTLLFDWIGSIVDWSFESKGFQELMTLINKKPKVDLIIWDTMSAQYLYPIIEKLGSPPVVATSQFGIQPYHTYSTGMDLQPAYIPMYFLPYGNHMTFFQRAENYFFTSFFILYRQYVYMPSVWKKSQKVFGENIKSYQEVEKNVSLVLANFDHVLDFPQSLPPMVIPVGGLHTKRVKEIPNEIKKILDDAKDGVLLFSLGTNYLSKDLQPDQKAALIKGLGKVKQTIIWKYEEPIEGLPKNFVTFPWVPQNDILAHPNTRAFLSHGGALGTQEAMSHGVPIICLPFFADQIINSQKVMNRKIGQQLNYGKLTENDVFNTANEVLNNPEYKRNAVTISQKYRDQPDDPLSRAVWWTEYVSRHKGAPHLQIASKDIPLYKLNMLDIWACLLVAIGVLVFVTKKILCSFCKSKSCTSKKNIHNKIE